MKSIFPKIVPLLFPLTIFLFGIALISQNSVHGYFVEQMASYPPPGQPTLQPLAQLSGSYKFFIPQTKKPWEYLHKGFC